MLFNHASYFLLSEGEEMVVMVLVVFSGDVISGDGSGGNGLWKQ